MSDEHFDYRAQKAQLIMSLKFHQSKTLSKLPIDVAIDALTQVWESCQLKPKTKPDDVIYL